MLRIAALHIPKVRSGAPNRLVTYAASLRQATRSSPTSHGVTRREAGIRPRLVPELTQSQVRLQQRYRHIARMRAAKSTASRRDRALPCISGIGAGQDRCAKSDSRELGMKRVRFAYTWRSPNPDWWVT